MIQTIQEDDRTEIYLRPNESASLLFNLKVLAACAVIPVLSAIGFAMAGLWLILPFLGGELLIVSFGMLFFFKKNDVSQTIRIKDYEITLEETKGRQRKCNVFPRIWTKFLIANATRPLGKPRIYLTVYGERREIAFFLDGEDRIELIKILKQAVQ